MLEHCGLLVKEHGSDAKGSRFESQGFSGQIFFPVFPESINGNQLVGVARGC